MKRFLKCLTLALAVVCMAVAFVGCGGSSWKGTTLNSWGAVQSNNGFVAETENYVYFINGKGTNTEDNSFGAPIKGSLMAISKTDFAEGKTDKAEIVVPKLFVASDYNAGIYISGDYVYYGTPSLDRDSSGKIANSEMAFAKSKLDGTETKILFSTNSLSNEYRILEKDGVVYIVYYDANAKEIRSYNASTKETKVITKTDVTLDQSLAEYKFIEDTTGGIAVVFTETVYAEKYFAEKAEKEGYNRATELYNKVYKYSVGDAEKVEVINGSEKAYTYKLTYADKNYVFYSQTDANGNVKNYGTVASEIADLTCRQQINSTEALAAATYMVSLNEIYRFDQNEAIIYKTTLVGSEQAVRETVAKVDSISAIVAVDDGNVYYYDTDNKIMRVKMGDKSADHVLASLDVAVTTWFAPEFITVNNNKYMLYLDGSNFGNNYVNYVNVSKDAVNVDTDDNAEADTWILDTNVQLAKVTIEDSAKHVEALLDKATTSTELKYVTTDNGIEFTKAEKALNAYDALSEEAKEFVSEANVTKFENVRDAIRLAKLYNELAGIKDYDGSDAQKQALTPLYQTAKTARQEIIDNGNYTTVRQMVPTQLKWFYQQANKLLAE
ncbi:MAG: hypothetical protein IKA12_02015 [Clostridia bacterium]|nr:hypothetical protein [Clostridia bacterium]